MRSMRRSSAKNFRRRTRLQQAWNGHVVAELDELGDAESARERAKKVPLLEIYSPIREPWSGEVVAVAEFYENASEINANLQAARLQSWLVVAAVAAATMALLSGIVFRGSRTIQRQREALTERVAELSALLAQNRALRQRVQKASRSASAINERYLRRIGADLHDGPAQLVAFAALRMDSEALVDRNAPIGARRKEIAAIRSSLDEAMAEIRSICSGLVLPHIETADLAAIVELTIAAHEQRTGSQVARPGKVAAVPLSAPERICIFRFLQETLNNAYRHAGGKEQTVEIALQEGRLTVAVSDGGPGFDPQAIRADGAWTCRPQGARGKHRRAVRLAKLGRRHACLDHPQCRGSGARMTQLVRLAIVDDHPLLREGVCAQPLRDRRIRDLRRRRFGRRRHPAGGGSASRHIAHRLSMPGGGLHAIQAIRASQPDMKIVVLTVSEANDDVTAALNAGAQGLCAEGRRLEDAGGNPASGCRRRDLCIAGARRAHAGEPQGAERARQSCQSAVAPDTTRAADPGIGGQRAQQQGGRASASTSRRRR